MPSHWNSESFVSLFVGFQISQYFRCGRRGIEVDFYRIEFDCLINGKSDAASEFLLQSEIGADFWDIPELLDEGVVRTRIVWIIRERVNEGNICGLVFITDGCWTLERLIDTPRTATGEQGDENKTSE